jgi:thiol:disulfide interchange protein
MIIPLCFIALSLLLAAPALWLLRRPAHWAPYTSGLLLLLATASGYIGTNLYVGSAPAPAHSAVPFQLSAESGHFQTITPAELPAALTASRNQIVLLEFYADWCSSCQVWKNSVFNRADVQAAMKPLVLLQIDASNITPDVQALLSQHQLVGLPALLVYDKEGREHPELRLLGEMTSTEFIHWINTRLLINL